MMEVNFLNPQINKIKNQEISIQVSLGGFSFCISASETKDCLAFRSYPFKNLLLEDELIRKVETIIESDTFLTGGFQTINFTYINQGSTLVPEEYFDKNNVKKYFEFNQNLGELDELHFSNPEGTGLYTIFSVPSYLAGHIYDMSSGAKVKITHQTERLIKLGYSKIKESTSLVIIGINKGFFDLVVFENEKLSLVNSFQYTNPTDFIYFYLYALKQLKFESSLQQPLVVGDQCTDKSIIDALKEQSKSITFPLDNHKYGCANLNAQQINRFYNLFI